MKKIAMRYSLYLMSIISCNQIILGSDNEESIKSCLRLMYCTVWEDTKKAIANIIIKGVSTPDLEAYDTWGLTPLCCAIEKDDTEFTEFLLQKNANPNFQLKRIHSSNPLFFIKSLSMLKLLEKYGGDLKSHNINASGWKENLLHLVIRPRIYDDALFDYLLEQGLVPKELTERGETLFHSLISDSLELEGFPEEKFIERVKKLKNLGFSPHEKGSINQSAYEQLKERIEKEDRFIENTVLQFNTSRQAIMQQTTFSGFKNRIEALERLKKFIKILTL